MDSRSEGEEATGDSLAIQMMSGSEAIVVAAETVGDEISPLLAPSEKPRMTIFSVSYPKRKRLSEPAMHEAEMDTLFSQFMLWIWSGTRYSGLFCVAFSSAIYCIMEVLSDIFSVGTIPLFGIVFSRCAIILILSFLWLRKTGQPLFGPTQIRKLLIARAVTGCFSLLSFIYSIKNLPLANVIVLSFTTPIMASIVARIIWHEKFSLADIGGLACSMFGLLFIVQSMPITQGGLTEAGEPSKAYIVRGSHPVYAVVIGLFFSTTAGISYCLIREAGKASDQPVVTVFAFGLLATPVAAICTFAFQDFIMPNVFSFLLMVILGVLAFFAEVFLARGLQLEKMSKVANMQYIEAFLSQIWGIALLILAPSFNRLVGCFIILASVCSSFYFGPEKEID